jgi:CheY-like chemotaxis protein
VLELAGAQVLRAASVREALERIDGEPPDLVVSDIGMAGEDGYALVERVRGFLNREGRPVPVVAVTAYATAQDAERVRAAGFSAHLAKPVDPRTVVSTLVEALESESAPPRGRPASA